MSGASFQRLPVYNSLMRLLKRAQLQQTLYGEHQQPNEWKTTGRLCQKIWANSGSQEKEINPSSDVTSPPLSFFWWLNNLQWSKNASTDSTQAQNYRVLEKRSQMGLDTSGGNVTALYFCSIYGVHCSPSSRLRVRSTLLNLEGKFWALWLFKTLLIL